MDLAEYVQRISHVARTARSESKLEGELNQILKECLHDFGIRFDPSVNEALRSMGLSQVDADRPDGVFGHIVYDYKGLVSFRPPRAFAKRRTRSNAISMESLVGI
jgi:hypothetical protein